MPVCESNRPFSTRWWQTELTGTRKWLIYSTGVHSHGLHANLLCVVDTNEQLDCTSSVRGGLVVLQEIPASAI